MKNAEAPTSHTMTYKNDLDKLRRLIKEGAKKDVIVKNTPTPVRTKTPMISDVVVVKDIENFTSETHDVLVELKSANYYSEQITTKIVGMETVDWWEYVLIYGFFKSLKLAYEYTKVKEYINKGVQSTRTVSGVNLEIKFISKMNNVKQNLDTVNGQTVIRETGTVYDLATIYLDVPQKVESKTQEYHKGYFVYEDTFTTLVIDYDVFAEKIEQMLINYKVHPSLIQKIIIILSNGRLSRI